MRFHVSWLNALRVTKQQFIECYDSIVDSSLVQSNLFFFQVHAT